MGKVRILRENCDLAVANNKDLPYNSYVVTYVVDGETRYDIVQPRKKMENFDEYWHKYREDFKPPWYQSEGRVNPKLWNDPNAPQKKK